MAIDSDLLRGHVDTIILKTLASGDKYGYEIIKEIETKSDGTFELKQPTLYSCLKRLETQGFISAYWVNSDIGGKRHYYKLTDQGRREYNANMSEWRNSRNIIDNLIFNEEEDYEHQDFQELNKDEVVATQNLANSYQAQESFIESPPVQEPKQEAEPLLDEMPTREPSENPQIVTEYYKTDENQVDIFTPPIQEVEDYQETKPQTNEKFEEVLEEQKSEEVAPAIQEEQIQEETIVKEETKPQDNSIFYSQTPQTTKSIKFNLKDFKSSKNNFFANSKDSVYNDEPSIEETSLTEIVSAPSFNPQEPVFTKPEEPHQDYHKFRNFSFYESMDENDETQELPPLYPNTSTVEDDEQEETTSSTLNFGYDQDNDDDHKDHEENTWENNFTLKTSDNYNDEFKYDYEKEIEESDSKEVAIREEYDTPALDEENEIVVANENNQVNLFTDNKRKFVPQYTDNESKQILNTLSSYGSTNFSSQEEQRQDRIVRTSYDEYKEELNSTGIDIKPYKKRVKNNTTRKDYILTNQIKFITSLISYIVVAISLVAGYFIASSIGYTDFSLVDTTMSPSLYLTLSLVAMLAIPCIFSIIFFLNQTKKAVPKYSAKIAIIFSLLFFVQCLVIIYAINIPFGLYSFTQKDYNHLLWLLPSICSLYIPIHAVVYTILFTTKKFHV